MWIQTSTVLKNNKKKEQKLEEVQFAPIFVSIVFCNVVRMVPSKNKPAIKTISIANSIKSMSPLMIVVDNGEDEYIK